MAWIAAIIGAAGAGLSANNSKKGNEKGSKAQLAAQKQAYEDAQKGLGPYAGLGPEAINRLGALMGMEGYRTPSDIALRDHLAAKPVLGDAGIVKKNASGFKGIIEKSEGASTLGDAFGSTGTAPTKFGSTDKEDRGGVTGYYDKKKRKRGQQQALNEAAKQAELATATAAWEAKKAELEKQRDFELQTYSPTAQLEKTPGYQYRYNTGLTTAKNSLAKMNMRQSGREQKELTQYGQEFGSGEFNNEFNRLTGLVTGGQNAQTTLGNISVGQGSALSNIYGQQARDNSQYYGNLNEGFQGSLSNYQTAKNRNNNNKYGSSYDSYPRGNSDADTYNPDYLE